MTDDTLSDTLGAPPGDTSETPPGDTSGAPLADTSGAPPGDTDDEMALLPPVGLSLKGGMPPPDDPDNPPPRKMPKDLWERMPKEPVRCYRAFEIYRAMDPEERSVRRLSEINDTYTTADGTIAKRRRYTWQTLSTWSAKWRWVARVDAWDTEIMRRRANKDLRDQERMHERHRDLALLMQQKVAERLKKLNPDELGRRDLDRWLEKAVHIERQARGLDRIGQAGASPNVSVGVGLSINGVGGPRVPEPQPVDETPIGQYLVENPSEVASAVNNIQELLALVTQRG